MIDTDWEESFGDEQVAFRRDARTWKRIPPRVRAMITLRLELLRDLRRDIAGSAAVGAMPPIVIDPAGWDPRTIGGFVWARASMMSIEERTVFSCEIPASTLYCVRDEELLRAIVVHEFAHAMFFQQYAVDTSDAGAPSIVLSGENPNDPDEDRRTLVDPALWFSPRDTAGFVFHNDARFEPAMSIFAEEWYRADLPIVPTNLDWPNEHARVAIAACVLEHARLLRGGLPPA